MGSCIYLRKGAFHTPPSTGILASELEVGTVVKLMEDGIATEFLVINQGIPDESLYDVSCNGTWLLRKDIYESRAWHSSDVNDYENSTIHAYLNGDFFNLFGSVEQAAIKQVKIPYRPGSGYKTTINSGANGLSAKIFLLSSTEVNLVHGYEPTNEGACLSYFSGTAQNGADTKRVAYLSGSATNWWLRSPYCNSDHGSSGALNVISNGGWGYYYCSNSRGIRPVLVLPSTAKFDAKTLILKS